MSYTPIKGSRKTITLRDNEQLCIEEVMDSKNNRGMYWFKWYSGEKDLHGASAVFDKDDVGDMINALKNITSQNGEYNDLSN